MVGLFPCAPDRQLLARLDAAAAINSVADHRSLIQPPKTGRRLTAPARPSLVPKLKNPHRLRRPAAES